MADEPDSPTTIEELHEALFGFVPKKEGISYERLSAVVFAALGWVDVEHDRLEQAEGKEAEHQLDVRCRHPDGSLERMVVECKDWKKRVVGQEVLDHDVGVRAQVGPYRLAVVTREGFTEGARRVARDEDIALFRLRPYEPEIDDGTWIRVAQAAIRMGFPVYTDVTFVTSSDEDRTKLQGARTHDFISLCSLDGELAETFGELWPRGQMETQADGSLRRSLALPEGRLVEAADGTWVAVRGIEWTQRIAETEETVTVEARGKPVLVIQELNRETGEPTGGKVIADEHFDVWDFDADNNVVRREAGRRLI